MARHRSVGRLELIFPVRADEHGSHHCQRTESGRDHVAHHIAVVVLAGPDEAALGADDTGHRIVNERVEIGQAGSVTSRMGVGRKPFRFRPGRVLC